MSDQQSPEKEKIESIRREYTREALTEQTIDADPISQFSRWFQEALDTELREANAMTLATATKDGKPSARTVLLKGFDEAGFRFFSNYESRKAKELQVNAHAALCFFWPVLERQVRVKGEVLRLSQKESDAYFQERPRESRLGAWASHQSQNITSRAELESAYEKIEKRFANQQIPTPEFWGGYRLEPSTVEFWQGRPGRLHDRIKYIRFAEQWRIQRLSP